ncbi:MAG: helix-turn-helix domain-containing protein [Lachnospiraceae bacterium]|nr:helix-turn-helix domain-containing protein [Lachnospiraceae bacterium]
MEINYVAIGKRVKKFRKERGLTQEKLAELLNISVPHMSNIENGKTKFSMPVLVSLINSLDITADMLLFEQITSKGKVHSMVLKEVNEVLMDCTEVQMQMIGDSVRSTKKLLQQYDEKINKKD